MKATRSHFLKAGSTLMSLPYLEALQAKEGSTGIPRRMGVFYYGTGMNMYEFEPDEKSVGKNYKLSSTLNELKNHKNDFTFLRGTYLKYGGAHNGDYTFTTGAKGRSATGIINSISFDQVAANQIGTQTRFPSIQLGETRGTGYGGNLNTLSWSENGVPLPSENDPHVVFNRLFKATNSSEKLAQEEQFKTKGSILDFVFQRAKKLQPVVSKRDNEKLDEYFNSVREVEKQLQQDIAWSKKDKPVVDKKHYQIYASSYRPGAPGFSYNKYAKLMFDLISLAWTSDSTRIVTYVVRRESSGKTWADLKSSTDFHGLTHHGHDPKKLSEFARVDRHYMSHWSYFMDKLKSIKEVDGKSLLDHSVCAFSSGTGIGHSKDRLPTVISGGKSMGIQHQGHLVLKPNTPLSCLWETMMHSMQLNVPENFQDSKGKIHELLA